VTRPEDQMDDVARPRNLENVLVVDDDHTYLKFVSLQLGRIGLNVLCAASHDAAMQYLGEGDEIDVMVLDYHMPGDHCEFLGSIRRVHPTLRIVGNSSMERRQDFAKLGVNHFLKKPWFPHDLIEILTNC